MGKRLFGVVVLCGVVAVATEARGAAKKRRRRMTATERIELVLRETKPLEHPLGRRLPMYVWGVMDVPGEAPEVERTLKELHRRGIGACATWRPGARQAESLASALRVGAIQKRLGLRVNINAIACTYTVFDGSAETAHVDAQGQAFFDTSSAKHRKLGCPFRVRHRYPAMRERMEYFVRAYKGAGVPIDFVFTDWEIDGPIEWNDGWAAAKRCVVCRSHIRKIDDFTAVQKAFRTVRSEMQRQCIARPVLDHFPDALVGNYSVYPQGKWRHWYDYFEKDPPAGAPVQVDQKAKYRQWVPEFEPCGYTFAMPVVYTWHGIWDWYDWANGDYRWFYNMLLVGSNAGEHTPPEVPIIPFVHYTPIRPAQSQDAQLKPMSTGAYRELLWHLLLRGHDTFFLWCPNHEIAQEIRPLHEVWSAALVYREFLDNGVPVTFAVPKQPGPVVSALCLDKRVLVRRTDFDATDKPVPITVGDATLMVPRVEGRCQVLTLP